MRSVVVVALLLLAAAIPAAAVGTVAAQSIGENVTNGNETGEEENRVIHELGPEDNPGAYVTNITWDGRTVYVTIEAERYTQVAVTDAGAFTAIDEGSSKEVPYETYSIPSGETRTIEFTVADTGTRAISIQAHDTMIGVVEEGFGFISGSASWREVQAGAAGGILFGSGIPLGVTIVIAIAGRWQHQRLF